MPDPRTDWKSNLSSIPAPPTKAPTLEVVADEPAARAAKQSRPPRTPAAEKPKAPPTPAPVAEPVSEVDRVGAVGTRNASFWVPRQVRLRLDAECLRTKLSITERAVDAFNATYPKLSEIFVQQSRPSGPIPVRKVRRRRTSGEEMVQVFLRLTPQEEAVIDDAVEKYAAPSRSALMTAVLDADLPPSG